MADNQKQSFPKSGASKGKSKEISSKSLPMIQAGGKSGSGPTGSKNAYAKGSKVSMSANFVPKGKNTFGMNGI